MADRTPAQNAERRERGDHREGKHKGLRWPGCPTCSEEYQRLTDSGAIRGDEGRRRNA